MSTENQEWKMWYGKNGTGGVKCSGGNCGRK